MWTFKAFKTKQVMDKWLSRKAGKIQYVEIFINNGYAVEYRRLRRVY